jgi:heat-inducible transcriptional repressor
VPQRAVSKSKLNERAQHFLKVLVERYILDGEPVGSRTLAKDAGLDLSPATVRNVMADLEEMGLVSAPHTSAGRVPTVEGYRLFVDSLLKIKPLNEREISKLRSQLDPDHGSPKLLESTSLVLSTVTRMAGIVMLPRHRQISFRQIEFLPLSGNRVLAILVTNEEEVLNRIIITERTYSAAELEQAANYFNHTFSGCSLKKVRDVILKEMREARADMDRIMARAMVMAEQVLEPLGSKDDCVIAGQTNLMSFNELADMDRLKGLFELFTEKHQILHLLDGCLQGEGVQIFIGEESGYQPFDNCSVVTSPYQIDDEVVGVLGVIGPKRMAYDRVIPIVDVTAKLLGAALKQR